MLTPLPRNSLPRATARWYISDLSQVAPVVIPAGKAVTLSVEATPSAESCRHSWGKPSRRALPVFPTHRLSLLVRRVFLAYVWNIPCRASVTSFEIRASHLSQQLT